MRVAVLFNRLSGGGAERVGTAWAEGLRRSGHFVDVIVTHQPEAVDDHEYLRLDASSILGRIWKLAKLIRTKEYEVVVSLMPHWNVMSLLSVLISGRRPRTIISLHSLEAGMAKIHGANFMAETALARLLYPAADAVVAVSHAVGAEAKSKYKIARNKLWVVPNPVLGSPSVVTHGIRSQGQAFSLVFAGRLVGQKNPDILIKCAAELMRKSDVSEVRVEFFGTGPIEMELRLEAKRLDVPVTFHGWCEDWTNACPNDAILVLPSLVEGFGNVLVEAAAIGVPSVASSKALGTADAVLPGVTGALAAGDRISDFCEAILQARSLPSFDVSRWLERFTVERSSSVIDRIMIDLGTQMEKG